MSQIAMTIADGGRAIHGEPHGSFVDSVVAALSADPETIEELEAALTRFIEPDSLGPFAGWSQGVGEEPYDAGICIVDLAARLVVSESTYSTPGPRGELGYRGAKGERDVWLPYHVSDEWMFSGDIQSWRPLAEQRRRARAADPPLDVREVLYGKVCEFIADECFAARGEGPVSGEWIPPRDWSLRELSERAKRDENPTAADAVAEIHARWLMSPRDDLRGQSPRHLLLAGMGHIDWDLQDRCHHWSFVGQCAPGLARESAAFRFGGFGTHENVLYYELVRHLVWECWERVVQPDAGDAPADLSRAEELARLDRVKDEWLNSMQPGELSGHTPAQVIERERMRLPMAETGKEAMVDDDCPLCQMMAEDMGPFFWHLDGCNMDDDFPFSFHPTREEWEKERREWEDFDRRFKEEQAQRAAAAKAPDDPLWDDSDGSSPVWQRSFANPNVEHEPTSIRMFGIGAHVAELGVDLKASADTASLAQALNRQFGNLRDAVGDPSGALVEPVVQAFCDELDGVSETRPDLADKCADLQRQLHDFAARLSAEPDCDDDSCG